MYINTYVPSISIKYKCYTFAYRYDFVNAPFWRVYTLYAVWKQIAFTCPNMVKQGSITL